MAIDLEHTFDVPVPPDQAWEVLLDVARVAPCMPGATVDEVDGDVVTGRIRVKVGPITMTYTGKATFTEKDPAAHSVRVEAAGRETKGAGTASATVHARLTDAGGQTRVTVQTSLNITGRPAQFGRGVMADVSGKLIEKFSANLAEQLAAGDAPTAPVTAAPAGSLQAGGGPDGRLSIPVRELNLPARFSGVLQEAGIATVGQLVTRTPGDLLALRNIGERSVAEIEERLRDLGLTLAGTDGERAAEPGETDEDVPVIPAVASLTNGNGPDGTGHREETGPAPRPAAALPRDDDADGDDGALNLLDVAAGPILKRVLPAAAVVAALAWAGLRLRRRSRRD